VKLLFDEMLVPSLVKRLSDLFQDSEHVRNLALAHAPDMDVWNRANELGCTIVTIDRDFANLSLVGAHRRRLLQLGNCTVRHIDERLRREAVKIGDFIANSSKGLLLIRAEPSGTASKPIH